MLHNKLHNLNLIFLPQLFLLHMDEILPNTVDNNNSIDAPIGCSTIIVNQPGNVRMNYIKNQIQL
jgi:hypothetical protein